MMESQNCNGCEKKISIGRKTGFCKICYSRDYRARNKDKIRPVSQKRYLRNRERTLERSKEYEKENREKINSRMREYNKNNKELKNLREKTRYEFNDLKKDGKCKECNSKKRLEFHHLKPYKYDRFEILCRECHLEKHGRLLVRKNKKEFLFVSEEVIEDE